MLKKEEINDSFCSGQEEKTKATFILHLQFRENDSWQGTIKWVEKRETLKFRSALELMKIINSAFEQGYEIQMDGYNGMELGSISQ